jgi:hypothetical protein
MEGRKPGTNVESGKHSTPDIQRATPKAWRSDENWMSSVEGCGLNVRLRSSFYRGPHAVNVIVIVECLKKFPGLRFLRIGQLGKLLGHVA